MEVINVEIFAIFAVITFFTDIDFRFNFYPVLKSNIGRGIFFFSCNRCHLKEIEQYHNNHNYKWKNVHHRVILGFSQQVTPTKKDANIAIVWHFKLTITQWARKFKNVQAKKNSWNQIPKSILRNCIFDSFKNFFSSSKIDFWPFLKLQKMEFGQKNFSWNWFIRFHEFFWPGLF